MTTIQITADLYTRFDMHCWIWFSGHYRCLW